MAKLHPSHPEPLAARIFIFFVTLPLLLSFTVVALVNRVHTLLTKPNLEKRVEKDIAPSRPRLERKSTLASRDLSKKASADTPAFKALLNAVQRRYMGMLLSLSLKNVLREFRRCFYASPPPKFQGSVVNPETYFATLAQDIRQYRVVLLGHLYYSALGQCHADPSLAVRHRIPTLASPPPAKLAWKNIMAKISEWPYPTSQSN